MEKEQHDMRQLMIEMRRQTALVRQDTSIRERETGMMKQLYEQVIMEIDSRNKDMQTKMEEQERRGRELENVIYKIQKLEQEEMNKLKRIFHEKIISDKERIEKDQEKGRVLFQELARLGENMREEGRTDTDYRSNIMRRISQLESRIEDDKKR